MAKLRSLRIPSPLEPGESGWGMVAGLDDLSHHWEPLIEAGDLVVSKCGLAARRVPVETGDFATCQDCEGAVLAALPQGTTTLEESDGHGRAA